MYGRERGGRGGLRAGAAFGSSEFGEGGGRDVKLELTVCVASNGTIKVRVGGGG